MLKVIKFKLKIKTWIVAGTVFRGLHQKARLKNEKYKSYGLQGVPKKGEIAFICS